VGNEINVFWEQSGDIYEVSVHQPFADLHVIEGDGAELIRYNNNPIISADSSNEWEAQATFNPAAVQMDDKIHLLYRAISNAGRSVVGHAVSNDGYNFKRRATPAYVPTTQEEGIGVPYDKKTLTYSSPYAYGIDGAEDPRATIFEDRLYMFYAAFNGYDQARTAGVSIDLDDFKEGRFFKWDKRILLTPPPTAWGTGGKNAALMPGKKDDNYVIFHRVWPDICIDYTKKERLSSYQKSDRWLESVDRIKPRPAYWDSGKIAVGAPPIEVDDGWLLIYTGVSQQTHDGYKAGAMILDKNDLSRVLYRTKRPILDPRAWYEREGLVNNVVYPCGAVIKDGTLLVYYGGADTHVCVATAPLDAFLADIKNSTVPEMNIKQASIKW
jgi:predicted GH43/DUF377 family glycosyl hydrolase